MPSQADARQRVQQAAAAQSNVPVPAVTADTATGIDPAAGVNTLLVTDRIQQSLGRALDGIMSTDRFASLVMTVMRGSDQLRQCDPMSVIAAAVQAAQLHLEPGPMQEAYLVPYYNNKRKAWEAQFIIGYRGIVQLAHRAGVSCFAAPVYEADEFDYCRGTGGNDFLRHKPGFNDRGNIVCFYGLAKWTVDGSDVHQFNVAGVTDIERHRDKYSKAKDNGPWVTNFVEMAQKTMIRDLSPWIPKATQLQRALAADETVRTSLDEITPHMADDAWVEREHQRAEDRATAALPSTPRCAVCNVAAPDHAEGCSEAAAG